MHNDDMLKNWLSDVYGICEATEYEVHVLGEKLQESGHTWKLNSTGLGQIVGYLDDMPVFLSLWTAKVDNIKFLFYEATSTVVDHRLIDLWMAKHVPFTAWPLSSTKATRTLNKSNMHSFPSMLACAKSKHVTLTIKVDAAPAIASISAIQEVINAMKPAMNPYPTTHNELVVIAFYNGQDRDTLQYLSTNPEYKKGDPGSEEFVWHGDDVRVVIFDSIAAVERWLLFRNLDPNLIDYATSVYDLKNNLFPEYAP